MHFACDTMYVIGNLFPITKSEDFEQRNADDADTYQKCTLIAVLSKR